LLCDIRLAGESATFGYSEVAIGIPASYATARAALGPAVARDLCLSGRVVEAGEARRLGVVSDVRPDEELMEAALERAASIAQLPRAAVLETKRRILLDGERSWGPLFEEEESAFRAALLEGEPEPAA
jgi:enoyl-CoA hydratase